MTLAADVNGWFRAQGGRAGVPERGKPMRKRDHERREVGFEAARGEIGSRRVRVKADGRRAKYLAVGRSISLAAGECDHAASCGLYSPTSVSATIAAADTLGLKSPK